MRLNPEDWHEVEVGVRYECASGVLHVRASEDIAVYVLTEDGLEVLGDSGRDIRIQLRRPFSWLVESPTASARMFVFAPEVEIYEPSGEVFTNLERRPHESGAVLEVRRAVREFQL